MSKTLNNVKLNVKFTKDTSTIRANIDGSGDSGENLATSLGKIQRWFDDLGTGAFTAAYTHPSNFTAKTTAGFYKYTVDTNGHVSAGNALAKSDITGLGIVAGYTFAEGSTNGEFTVTPEGGSAQSVTVHGLGSAAYASTASSVGNNSNLPTGAAVTSYVTGKISELGNILTFKGVVDTVDELPSTGNTVGDVYFVGTNTTGSKDDFTEYVWANVAKTGTAVYDWEYLGKVQVDVDLSAYLTSIGASNTSTNDAVKLKFTQTKNNGTAADVAELTLQSATTSKFGVTKLTNAYSADNNTSETLAATQKAVHEIYVLANGKTSNTGTVTSITPGTGLVNGNNDAGTVTSKTAISTTGTISLQTSGATAGSYGPSEAVTGNDGTTLNVPYITVDKYGRVTAIENKVYTSKNTENTDTKVTQSINGGTDNTDKFYPLLLSYYDTTSSTTTAQTTQRANCLYANIQQVDSTPVSTLYADIFAGTTTSYKSGTYANTIVSGTLSGNVTQALPAVSGTILNSGNTSVSRSLTSGTKIATLTINGTATDLYCQTNSDTKVTVTTLEATTAAASYKPTFVSAAGTAGENIINTFEVAHKPGTTSAVGNTRIVLGNATASGTANNEEGQLELYSSGTKKAILKSAKLTSADVEHILPDSSGTDGYLYNNLEVTGSGNAVTAVSAANGKITFTKGETYLTAHPTISASTDTTSTASPAHGTSFTVIDSVTRDTNGHVTKVNTKTVTLPANNNTDTLVAQTLSSAAKNYPLLLSYYETSNTSTSPNAATSNRVNSIYANPSTGTVTATKFTVTTDVATSVSDNTVATAKFVKALGYTSSVFSTSANGLVPKPASTSSGYLKSDGTWSTAPIVDGDDDIIINCVAAS